MDHTYSKIIGRRLTLIIEDLNLTHKDFANELGVAASTVSAIINATHLPSADFLSRLIKVFNVNANYILNGIGDMFLNDNSNFKTVEVSSLKDIDNINILVKVMRESSVFRHSILAHASYFFHDNKRFILRSLNLEEKTNGGFENEKR